MTSLFDDISPGQVEIITKRTTRGGVPGGHDVICEPGKDPFVPPMRECVSVPLQHDDVVVDIGAYCGTYAFRCARFPVCLVRAFEPSPATFGVLSRTTLPNLQNVNAAVVGDHHTGPVSFYVSRKIGVTNSCVPSSCKDEITVPSVRYSDAVRDATIVKIDIEGGEYWLGDLVRPSIRALIIDFHSTGTPNWQLRAVEIIQSIERAGFSPIIRPDFSNGWTQAGSWIRDVPGSGAVYEPMMTGRICCGCGGRLAAAPDYPGRSLCQRCWDTWTPKHRVGYSVQNR